MTRRKIMKKKAKKSGALSLDFVWRYRLQLRAEVDKLWAESSKLWAEGDKLRAESDKLRAEGGKLWAEAIIEACGNVQIECVYRSAKQEAACKVESFSFEP